MDNRREFIKKAAISGIGLSLANKSSLLFADSPQKTTLNASVNHPPDIPFIPKRIGSWWVTIEDLQWSQKKIVDNIKRRAAGFAEAGIDTAINFGFHIRFDFSNYFGQLHGYYANVCEDLHQYGIKFMDHYSCNNVERPRGEAEFKKMMRGQRHHVLLFHDPIAAEHAQYAGHYFKDICEVDIRDGSRGYAWTYQFEAFCHNNPNFLDMHSKYLERLLKEVPIDGIQVDDMCDYAGLTTCGCKYCRGRFKKDYGHAIPTFGEKAFWGDVTKPANQWGNYENPVFRDWLSMKSDVIADHVKLVKKIIGNKSLMTCCSSTGPISLNVVSLDLEKMAPHLDLFMLENVGTNVNCVKWARMDAEALNQKDIAEKRGNAPAMACSYTIYEKGAYLGWGLSRFWGVANWCSIHNHRPIEDPVDAREMEDVIREPNKWEIQHSDLDYRKGKDMVEVRLLNNRYCRDNGWRDEEGTEHWTRVDKWADHLLSNNVGYRFVRAQEFADATALLSENTPLVLDGVGCVSDSQFKAIKTYLSKGGIVWLALPFGTHNDKGFKRATPLSDEILKNRYKNLMVVDSAAKSKTLKKLIDAGKFKPVLKLISGDTRWVARIRIHNDKPVIHFMNTALIAIPHPTLKDPAGNAILKDIDSAITNHHLQYEIHTGKLNLPALAVMSPEIGGLKRTIGVRKNKGVSTLQVDLSGIKVYAIAQD